MQHEIQQPQPTAIPKILRPDPSAFAPGMIPREFQLSRKEQRLPKNKSPKKSISIDVKNPNVVDISTASKNDLIQLLGRNEDMLQRKTFINSLADKGMRLKEMNIQIKERLAQLDAVSKDQKSHQPSMEGLENMLLDLSVRDDGFEGTSQKQLTDRQRKTLFAGGKVPAHLKETKVKTLSIEESTELERKHFELERQLLETRLEESAGIVGKKSTIDSLAFDRMKFRTSAGQLARDSDDESDDGWDDDASDDDVSY
ncbi:hypothetical protein HDU82_003766 [Entophlyctis luteolus]|nr:hypothetical protein HDU82_003766 [Entophlyctis luteolus]